MQVHRQALYIISLIGNYQDHAEYHDHNSYLSKDSHSKRDSDKWQDIQKTELKSNLRLKVLYTTLILSIEKGLVREGQRAWNNKSGKPEYAVHLTTLTEGHSKVIISSGFSTKNTKSLRRSSFTNCLRCEEFNKT